MKKVLFSAHCKTQEQKYIVHVLLEMLFSKNHSIEILTNFVPYMTENEVQIASTNNLQAKNYDVILAYNLKGYNKIKHLAKTKNIPVIYVIKQEDSIKEFLYDVSIIDKFLIINDGFELPRHLFPEDCSANIPYPYLPPQQNKVVTGSSSYIMVSTDDKTLLKFIPALNNYTKYNFNIVTGIPSIIKKIVNENCTVVSSKKINILDLIKNTALVVGSGKTILTSLGYGKPSIVVGKFGFGRRVTQENIEQHFHSLFRGRLGAQGEEIIPFHLLSHEIDSCMNAKQEENEAISNSIVYFLAAKYKQTASLIDRLICSTGISESVLDMQLRLSSLYRFIPINELSYMVVDNRMYKAHAMIDKNDYDLIHSFGKGSTVKSVMQKNLNNKTHRRFISFIEYLISYKFLVPIHDKRTNF